MFEVTIVGKVEHKRYLKRYAKDILYHFFKDRIKRTVPITIKVVDYLDGDWGWCYGTRSEVTIELARAVKGKKNRKRRTRRDQLIETLAHELIHAKQFIRGEINQRNLVWRGQRGPYDCRRLAYRKTPWEKEAFGQEKELKQIYWDKHYKHFIK
jgi:hypothetical protein